MSKHHQPYIVSKMSELVNFKLQLFRLERLLVFNYTSYVYFVVGSYEVLFYDGFKKKVQPINLKPLPPSMKKEVS